MKYTFRVTGRPQGKGRPRSAPGQSRPYTPKHTVLLERRIRSAFQDAFPGFAPLAGPVRVTVTAVFDIPKSWPAATREAAKSGGVYHTGRGDADNIAKAGIDALNCIAFLDDGQVAILNVLKRYGSPERTVFTIEALEQPGGILTPGQSRAETKAIAAEQQRKGLKLGAPRKLRNAGTSEGDDTPLGRAIAAALVRDAK